MLPPPGGIASVNPSTRGQKTDLSAMLQRARRNKSASDRLGVLTPVTAKDAQFPLINRVMGPPPAPASGPLNRIPQSNIREMSQASHPGGTFLYTSSIHLKMILMTRG